MLNRIIQLLRSKKGGILSFIVITPFIIYLITVIVTGGIFYADKIKFSSEANKQLDMALVKGQFTTSLQNTLKNNLTSKGFDESHLQIEILPTAAGDSDNDTFAPRETEIRLTAIHKKPHLFYYVCKFVVPSLSEKRFYIGTQIDGMSEHES